MGTASPTDTPTAIPTASPTASPTATTPTSSPTVIPIAKPTSAPTAKAKPLPKVRKLKCPMITKTETLQCTWLQPKSWKLVKEYQVRAKKVGGKWINWLSNGLSTKYNRENLRPGRYLFQVRVCNASGCGKERTSKHRVKKVTT